MKLQDVERYIEHHTSTQRCRNCGAQVTVRRRLSTWRGQCPKCRTRLHYDPRGIR